MKFVVDAESCVGCLACARVCPTGAIAVPADRITVQVVDEACIRCGLCLPACPHDAVHVSGELGKALAIAARDQGVLILGSEAPAHFYPATPEQVVNACYAVGFRVVSRGVVGDELVAQEYLRLWEEEGWGTMIRSTDQVVVDAVRTQYPELVPFLAPIATPVVAEARYLRSLGGPDVSVVYAGGSPTSGGPELDASITFGDLEQIFALRGVSPLTQPVVFDRVPMERRRHLSAAGGMPLAMLEEARQSSRRFHKIRGLDGLRALARAVAVDRIELGFVDMLSSEGVLDHPALGPREELYWRRWVVQNAEPPRSRSPVVENGVKASIGAVFDLRPRLVAVPDPVAVRGVLDAIGPGPNGRPWDCRACGYATCQQFAEAVVQGRSAMRLCGPYLQRAAEDSQRAAATDLLTGLASFRVLRDRLAFEAERCKRSGEKFAVLFVDLDRLKEINDHHGHEAGNEVLRAVGLEVRNAVRASDLAARYGGDEFVVILTRTDEAGARRVAEVLREGIERVGRRLGFGASVTVSIGISEYDPADPTAGDPLVNADRALYKAKAMGRNTVV